MGRFVTFPSDEALKKEWVGAIDRESGWAPTKFTRICSIHFAENCFYETRKGLRKIRQGAIPTLNMKLKFKEVVGNENKENIPIDKFLISHDTQREKILKQEIRRLKVRERKLNLKVRKYQMKTKRLKQKVSSMAALIQSLQKKNFLSGEEADILTSINAKTRDLINRQICKIKKMPLKKKYTPALRSFALTLHYYSPRAYIYVRRTFDTCLPHPRTLAKWYSSVNGDAGFTSEAFKILKSKTDITNKRSICCLVMDEMAIKKHVEWDGNKYHGYVDVGTHTIDNDTEAKASEALVLLLVCVQERWKLPVGYFLVNSVTGEQRATLIKHCLTKCDDAGVDVVALTNDGCPSNITMAKLLGCSFDINNIKSTFRHPTTNKEIAYFLDACHMLKLVRNAFEKKKTLLDYQGNKLEWSYIVQLNEIQNQEGFHAANKLKNSHVNFERQKMKVRLASQLFSNSVADALELCRQNEDPTFKNASATIQFIQIINNLFDVLNSRNMLQFGFKKPLFAGNIQKTRDFLEYVEKYITYLVDYQENKPVLNTSRKTGFLGFIVCIRSALHLYTRLVEDEKQLIYLPLHKVSQDHLELFFCVIRSHGRASNNPTTRQFKSAYKKTMVQTELKDAFGGNCIPLEDVTILSTIDTINNSSVPRMSQDDCQSELQNPIEDDVLLEFDSLFRSTMDNILRQQIITYIAGYVVMQLRTKIKCENCLEALFAQEHDDSHRLVKIKNKGGLCFASKDVVDVCVHTECSIRSLKSASLNNPAFKKHKIVSNTLKSLLGKNIFASQHVHMFDQSPFNNHTILLCKTISERYTNIRMRYFSICENIRDTRRQQLNKTVIFMGD